MLSPSCGIQWINQPPCQYGLTPPSGSFTGLRCITRMKIFKTGWTRSTSGEENPGSTRIGDSTGASQVDVPELNSPSSIPVMGQPALCIKEMARALMDFYARSEPKRGGYQKGLEREWLSKYPHLSQTCRTLAWQAKTSLVGDVVLQVTGSRDLDLLNDAPHGASRRRRIQGVIWNLQKDNIPMELYRESKPMEKGYAKRLYQAWNAAMPDHKTTKVALTASVSRIRRGQSLSRLNLVEPDSGGVATLTGTVEEGVGAQGLEELHQVQAEQNGELFTGPVETPTHDRPSPKTSGNDHLMQLLGKVKDACLQKKPGDYSDGKPCGAVRFSHVDTAPLQEANDWVEKEWQEGPRLAWHLNCLVYSVAMAVRGKTTYESQPCNQGRKSDNQKGSKRQEGHINDRKAKGLRFRRLLAWLDVEIARQQNNNPMTKCQEILRRKLRREFHSLNLNVLIRAREQTLGKLRV